MATRRKAVKDSVADFKAQLAEARAQQAATADILKVIAASPSDVQPVFDAIVACAHRLFPGRRTTVRVVEGDNLILRARAGNPFPNDAGALVAVMPISRDSLVGQVILECKTTEVTDTRGPDAPAFLQRNAARLPFRSMCAAPLLRDGKAVGVIAVYSTEPGHLSDRQKKLLLAFADQAVIAIENVRLFNETKEALERQTATAEILNVISSSPTDVQPVFEAIVRTGVRLFKDAAVVVVRPEGGQVRLMAIAESDPGQAEKWASRFPFPLDREYMQSAAILDCRMVEVADALQEQESFVEGRRNFAMSGYRAMTVSPMVRDNVAIGAISVVRLAPGPLSERQKALLRTFADQAVIAIENVRLFNETKEALERQTATAEILKVISSSPTDVEPVFEAIVASASRLFGANAAILMREGANFHLRTACGPLMTPAILGELRKLYPLPLDPDKYVVARVIAECKLAEILDTEAPGLPEAMTTAGRVGGFRAATMVPLQREGVGIGAIGLSHPEPGFKLNEKQLGLLQTFADQAVIAIENVRLFNEARALEEERLGRLKSFFSPQLAELLAAGKGEDLLKTHRREITVQFFDLRGFTAFTGAAEPEEVMELLREFHGALGKLVLEHQGTIERFGGDSVMVFFNDPLPVERPAEHAMQSAIAMMRAFDPIAVRWTKRGYDLGLGAGIAQGFATLGAIGFEGRRDYAAIGPVTNLAARLCAEAKSGQILADRKTVAALEGAFEFDALGELELKGFSKPVAAFALRGA